MRRVGLQCGRRVPLYVGLPIVIACGATGYMASTTMLPQTATRQPQILGLPKPSEGVVSQPTAVAGVSATSVEPSSIALATPEVHLPAPARIAIERNESVPEYLADVATSAGETRPVSDQSGEGRTVQSTSKPRRSHRMTRRPKSAPATASNGIQNVPLLGPLFSVMQ